MYPPFHVYFFFATLVISACHIRFIVQCLLEGGVLLQFMRLMCLLFLGAFLRVGGAENHGTANDHPESIVLLL